MNPSFQARTMGHLKEEKEGSRQKEKGQEGGLSKKRFKGIYIKKHPLFPWCTDEWECVECPDFIGSFLVKQVRRQIDNYEFI